MSFTGVMQEMKEGREAQAACSLSSSWQDVSASFLVPSMSKASAFSHSIHQIC